MQVGSLFPGRPLLRKAWLLALSIALVAGPGWGQEDAAARAAALERLQADLDLEGVSGTFVEQIPGQFQFAPSGEPLVLQVSNPERIASSAAGPPLRIYGALDASSGTVEVRDYRVDLALPAGTEAAPSALVASSDPDIEELNSLLTQFADEVNAALTPGAMSVEDLDPEGDGPIATAERNLSEGISDLYARAVDTGNGQLRSAVVEQYARAQQVPKAVYGAFDNYPPWSYERIYRNANSVVALGEPGEPQAICSGVLVGPDLVLTAGHCFGTHLPEDLEVWFDFAEDQESIRDHQTRAITELVAPSADKRDAFFNQAFGRDLYDYAIVRFATVSESSDLIPLAAWPSCQLEPAASPPSDASAELAAHWPQIREEWQARCIRSPQCLRDTPARRERPLYVVGYPKGQRERVHDNGRVYLPYQTTVSEFNALKLEIEADYLDRSPEERDKILKDFTDSYVLRHPRYFLEDVRLNGQPKMGIVADTFRGNSGSPVYDRDQHCLVGILTNGAEDTGQRLLASWLYHESVLPVAAILNDLEKHADTKALIDQGVLEVR